MPTSAMRCTFSKFMRDLAPLGVYHSRSSETNGFPKSQYNAIYLVTLWFPASSPSYPSCRSVGLVRRSVGCGPLQRSSSAGHGFVVGPPPLRWAGDVATSLAAHSIAPVLGPTEDRRDLRTFSGALQVSCSGEITHLISVAFGRSLRQGWIPWLGVGGSFQ